MIDAESVIKIVESIPTDLSVDEYKALKYGAGDTLDKLMEAASDPNGDIFKCLLASIITAYTLGRSRELVSPSQTVDGNENLM